MADTTPIATPAQQEIDNLFAGKDVIRESDAAPIIQKYQTEDGFSDPAVANLATAFQNYRLIYTGSGRPGMGAFDIEVPVEEIKRLSISRQELVAKGLYTPPQVTWKPGQPEFSSGKSEAYLRDAPPEGEVVNPYAGQYGAELAVKLGAPLTFQAYKDLLTKQGFTGNLENLYEEYIKSNVVIPAEQRGAVENLRTAGVITEDNRVDVGKALDKGLEKELVTVGVKKQDIEMAKSAINQVRENERITASQQADFEANHIRLGDNSYVAINDWNNFFEGLPEDRVSKYQSVGISQGVEAMNNTILSDVRSDIEAYVKQQDSLLRPPVKSTDEIVITFQVVEPDAILGGTIVSDTVTPMSSVEAKQSFEEVRNIIDGIYQPYVNAVKSDKPVLQKAGDIGLHTADLLVPGVWLRHWNDVDAEGKPIMKPTDKAINIGLDLLMIVPLVKIASVGVKGALQSVVRASAKEGMGEAGSRIIEKEFGKTLVKLDTGLQRADAGFIEIAGKEMQNTGRKLIDTGGTAGGGNALVERGTFLEQNSEAIAAAIEASKDRPLTVGEKALLKRELESHSETFVRTGEVLDKVVTKDELSRGAIIVAQEPPSSIRPIGGVSVATKLPSQTLRPVTLTTATGAKITLGELSRAGMGAARPIPYLAVMPKFRDTALADAVSDKSVKEAFDADIEFGVRAIPTVKTLSPTPVPTTIPTPSEMPTPLPSEIPLPSPVPSVTPAATPIPSPIPTPSPAPAPMPSPLPMPSPTPQPKPSPIPAPMPVPPKVIIPPPLPSEKLLPSVPIKIKVKEGEPIPKELLGAGVLEWRQGVKWIASPPPYKTQYYLDSPLPGTYKFAVGKGSARKTLQVLGGPLDRDATVDMGWAIVHIKAGERDLTMDFKGGKDAANKRWAEESQQEAQTTEGSIVSGQGGSTIGLEKMELPQYRAGKLRVYTVNGQYVRDNYLIDFTQGGHYKVYPEFIPKNEIWLDNNLNIIDRKATLLHELAEMGGWKGEDKYSEVHNEVANPIEAEGRRNVGEMDEMIDGQLERYQGEPRGRSAYPVTSQINRAKAMVRAIRRKAQSPKEDEPIPDNVYRGHKLYTTVSGATNV